VSILHLPPAQHGVVRENSIDDLLARGTVGVKVQICVTVRAATDSPGANELLRMPIGQRHPHAKTTAAITAPVRMRASGSQMARANL